MRTLGLVEVYDLNRSADAKLANISTRGFVRTGSDVLIGGVIVIGDASQKVIVRALGRRCRWRAGWPIRRCSCSIAKGTRLASTTIGATRNRRDPCHGRSAD